MGELIRKAREESGLSQADLAQNIYRRGATLSDTENGKTEVSSGTLVLLAAALDKPLTYFFPSFVYKELMLGEFTSHEQELLTSFRNIWSDHLRKVAIDQHRTLEKYNPMEMIEERWKDKKLIHECRRELKRHSKKDDNKKFIDNKNLT